LYGLIAELDDADLAIESGGKIREAGYKKIDGYSPMPMEGFAEALGLTDMKVPYTMLAGGLLGCAGGFSFLYWCSVISYPLNIGGKPLFGWPSWVPITFECTVLVSALVGIIGMILYNGLPMPYHPVFGASNFNRATDDKFFLCIESSDPQFDLEKTRAFLESLPGVVNVSEVELEK
jgi:hypothetical protein